MADKVLADKAIAKNAAEKDAADKVIAKEKAAEKEIADKAAAKAAADKAEADKIAENKAAVASALAKFSWHNSEFGVMFDSAKVEYGFITIKGRAVSLDKSDYAYLQITFGLYTKSGNKIGTALANINNLEAETHGNLRLWEMQPVVVVQLIKLCCRRLVILETV